MRYFVRTSCGFFKVTYFELPNLPRAPSRSTVKKNLFPQSLTCPALIITEKGGEIVSLSV